MIQTDASLREFYVMKSTQLVRSGLEGQLSLDLSFKDKKVLIVKNFLGAFGFSRGAGDDLYIKAFLAGLSKRIDRLVNIRNL